MESALIIPRTQQITTFETGMTNTVDSLLEPYYMENLTNSLENMTFALIEELSNGENILPLQEEYFIKKQRDSMRLLFSREDREHIGVA